MKLYHARYAIYSAIVCVLITGYLIVPAASPLPFSGQQIWKHRQNSPKDTISASLEGFPGIEVDLTYLEGQLHVAHDETEYEDAIPLSEFLFEISEANVHPLFWFDIKNIGLANEAAITREIIALDISDRMIVELPRPLFMFRLCSSGATCSVWIQGGEHWYMRVWYRFWVNMLSWYGAVGSISLDYRLEHLSSKIVPQDFPKLLFILPNISKTKNFHERSDVRILLSD